MPRITHEHLHQHLLSIEQEQERQSAFLRRIFRKVGKIMATAEDLAREMAETRTALTALLAKMQELIDQIGASTGNQAAIDAAVAELDQLQTDMNAAVNPNP